MLKDNVKVTRFVLMVSLFTLLFFHYPFFKYVCNHINYKSFNGALMVVSFVVLMIVANAFFYYMVFSLSRRAGKVLLFIFLVCNAVAVYFVNTYNVILDETMMGNVLNTRSEEAGSFFSWKLILYIVVLGIIPGILFGRIQIVKDSWKRGLITVSATLVFIIVVALVNSPNWLWVDSNSKELGGLAMPWSYTANLTLLYKHRSEENQKEIPLPDATIKDHEKAVVVLVLGESARSANFSLYGYPRNTNPLLSQTPNVAHFDATSCDTYTTAGLKCILEHQNTGDLYEILPNYLNRSNVEVIWRSTNWGEPPVHIQNFMSKDSLLKVCQGEQCNYDELLLTGLKEQILASRKDKILVVLHTSISHGPTYSKKYPPAFEVFKPVCNSVELGQCSQQELVNAYDNTVVYTDYLLHKVIEDLKQLPQYKSTMLFVSDHGESLGEKKMYMHGIPKSIAPDEQFKIPFIVWMSDQSRQLKPNKALTQHHVFHSVLNFLGVQSPVYDEAMNIYK